MTDTELKINSEDDEKATKKTSLVHHLSSSIRSYIFLSCLFIIPIVATIIYIGFRGNLDECNAGFKNIMLSIIIMGFVLISCTIIERYSNNVSVMPWISTASGSILCLVAFVVIYVDDNTCKKASPHVYNFIYSIVCIPFSVLLVIIVIIVLTEIFTCISNTFNLSDVENYR